MVSMEEKKAWLRIRVTREQLDDWKNAAIDMRYMNFSQFVRDAIEEKIRRFNEQRGSNTDSLEK